LKKKYRNNYYKKVDSIFIRFSFFDFKIIIFIVVLFFAVEPFIIVEDVVHDRGRVKTSKAGLHPCRKATGKGA